MIVIRIEMWPRGDVNRRYDLGLATITNVGGTAQRGDYKIELAKSASHGARKPGIWRRGIVRDFPRLRLGQYDLLLRALIACIGGRSSQAVAEAGAAELGLADGEAPIGAEENARGE